MIGRRDILNKGLKTFLVVFFLNLLAFSNVRAFVSDGTLQNITSNVSYYIDQNSSLSFEEVKKSKFKIFGKASVGFAPSLEKTYWFKFQIASSLPLFLVVNLAQLDHVDLYKREKGKETLVKNGDMVSWKEKKFPYRYPVFSLNPQGLGEYYLRVKGPGTMAFQMMVMDRLQLIKDQSKEKMWDLAISAAVLILLFYNFLIFLSTGDGKYGVYCLYLVIVFMSQNLIITGWHNFLLRPKNTLLSNNIVVVAVYLQISISSYLTISFLSTKKWMPRWHKALLFMTGLYFIGAVFSLHPVWIHWINAKIFYPMIKFSTLFILLSACFGFYYGYKSRWEILRPAKFYLPAYAAYLVGALMLSMVKTGALPYTYFSTHYMKMGTLIELLILSLGLADIINSLRISEKKKAEELAKSNKDLEELNVHLEERVQSATYELEMEKMSIEHMMEQTYEQKRDRDQLLGSLNQGYLTFNREGIVQDGATKVTESLLETSLLESAERELKIWEVLFKKDEEKETFQKWLGNVFGAKLSFKDLKNFAPQIFKGTKEKFIELDFRPIYVENSNHKIDKVICIASDNTKQKALEKQHERDKEQAKFVKTCLEHPVEFGDLIVDTYDYLDSYNSIKNKDELFRAFHTLKARFGKFGVKNLVYYLNEIESGISDGMGENLHPKIFQFKFVLKEFMKKNTLIIQAANKFMVDDGQAIPISEMIDKIKNSGSLEDLQLSLKSYLLSDIKEKFGRYKPLVKELSEQQGKTVDVEISGDEVLVEYSQYSDFVNVSIHLFRNMVDHGIETEEERSEKEKSPRGKITINFKNNGKSFFIHFIDDGGGIDPSRIRAKVLEKGLKTSVELEKLNDSELLPMIFLPGFSTKEEVTDISGRGVGMDAVKAEIEKLGGSITVSSILDEGTTFVIELPLLN